MALSRFWTLILILSISYVLIMLALGRQYTLGNLVNGKQGEALVVAEYPKSRRNGRTRISIGPKIVGCSC